MNEEQLWAEVKKILVATKVKFPTKTEQRKGKNVVIESVYVVDIKAVVEQMQSKFTIQIKK